MDWGNVTAFELLEALKDVDWHSPPRPVGEFFTRFTPPKSAVRWTSRMKCNVYYYRTNYVILFILGLVIAFARNPIGLFAILNVAFAGLLLNDKFAEAVGTAAHKVARKVSPPLAAKMQAGVSRKQSQGHIGGTQGKRPTAKKIYILGLPRMYVAGGLTAVFMLVLYKTGAIISLLGGILLGAAAVVAHATARSPNLKARLETAQQEFAAVWRGYGDYTL